MVDQWRYSICSNAGSLMLIDGNIMSLFLSRNFRNGEHRTYLATISNLFLYTYTLGYVYKIVKNLVDIITHILFTR